MEPNIICIQQASYKIKVHLDLRIGIQMEEFKTIYQSVCPLKNNKKKEK
jgi:hypothetical protein